MQTTSTSSVNHYSISCDTMNSFINADPQLNELYQDCETYYVLRSVLSKHLESNPEHKNPESTSNKEEFLNTIVNYTNQLLNIAQKEVSQGHLQSVSIKKNDISVLTSTKTGNTSKITKVVKHIFNHHLKIQLNDEMADHFNLSWNSTNPYLNPKPVYTRQHVTLTLREQAFMSLLNDDEIASFCDVKFSVNGEIISAHRVFLVSQSSYFKKMFLGNWKEKIGTQDIIFNQCQPEIFKIFLQYLYKGKINANIFSNMEQTIELALLANMTAVLGLKDLCLDQIYQKGRLKAENFLSVYILQMQLEDMQLKELCAWFIRKNPNYGEELNFSQLDILEILTAYEAGKTFKAEKLIQTSLNQLQKILKSGLDDSFLKLCQKIQTMKDHRLKTCLIEVIKNNPSVLAQLKERKDSDLKQHWDAYVEIMTDVTI